MASDKVERGQAREVQLELLAGDNELRVHHVSYVQTDYDLEVAVLNFYQGLPQPQPGKKKMRLVFRCSMTWPHIVRTHRMLGRIIEQQGEAARKYLADSLAATPATEAESEVAATDERA